MAQKQIIFLVHWKPFDADGTCFEQFEPDDGKFIGVYGTSHGADAAIARSRLLPGFCNYPQSFIIDEYIVDNDCWTSGFPEKAPL